MKGDLGYLLRKAIMDAKHGAWSIEHGNLTLLQLQLSARPCFIFDTRQNSIQLSLYSKEFLFPLVEAVWGS
jgi:hypothetical protein